MGQTISTGGSHARETAYFGNPSDNRDLVEGRYNDVSEKADTLYDAIIGPSGFIAALQNSISAHPTISIAGSTVSTDITIESSGLSAPQFNNSDLAEYPQNSISSPENLNLELIFTDDLLLDDLDEQDNVSLTWEEAHLPEELYTAIISRMIADLQSGSTGISEETEAAIYERARYRQQVDRQNAYDSINSSMLDCQFAYPSGLMAAALANFNIGANRADADIENQIIVTQADLAQKNSQAATASAVQLEQLLRTTREGESNRSLDAAKHIASLISERYRNAIQLLATKLQNLQIIAGARAENLKASLDEYKSLMQKFETEAKLYGIESEAVTAYNKGIVEVFSGKVSGFSESEKAIASRNASSVALLAEQVKNSELTVRAAIATAEQTMVGYTTESNLGERISEVIATVASQLAASIFSSFHASAALGYSASESSAVHGSVSISMNETHNTDYEAD